MLMAVGIELLENRPLTDSPEIPSPLSVLCDSAVNLDLKEEHRGPKNQ
jgi:hypothetical protein